MASNIRSAKIHGLIKNGVRAKYSKGQIIQSTERQKTMNFITKGYVKRYLISNSGNLGVEVIYGPEDFFPLTLMLDTILKLDVYEGPEVYFYEAMTETVVYATNVDDLAKLAQHDPLLYKDLLRETGRRLQTTLNSLENLALESPDKRLAHQLIYFATVFGKEMKSGIKILVPLTPQDLTDILMVNAQNIEACLNKLQGKGLIKRNKHIIVTDIDKLKEEAHN
jgi:CRP-like cAMP-binding protein